VTSRYKSLYTCVRRISEILLGFVSLKYRISPASFLQVLQCWDVSGLVAGTAETPEQSLTTKELLHGSVWLVLLGTLEKDGRLLFEIGWCHVSWPRVRACVRPFQHICLKISKYPKLCLEPVGLRQWRRELSSSVVCCSKKGEGKVDEAGGKTFILRTPWQFYQIPPGTLAFLNFLRPFERRIHLWCVHSRCPN